MPRRGRLYVIAAPSGAGKTSLLRALMERRPAMSFSVSSTTRGPRPHETHGHDYFFVDRAQFERMAAAGEFVEHADVFGNLYGTSRAQVDAALAEGRELILDIDVQGARQVRERVPEAVHIFILPPSRAELERRLRDRRTDSEEAIARRLADSVQELGDWDRFDYVIVNDDFAQSLAALEAICEGRGDGWRRNRPGLGELVAALRTPAAG